MAREIVDENARMSLRIRPEQKAMLRRAAALRHTDLTDFVVQNAVREAESVIQEAETIKVSERDYMRIMELLENPPSPNAKLRAAVASLPGNL